MELRNTTILRAPTETDLPFLVRMRNNQALQTRLMAVPRANTTERVRDWIGRLTSDSASVFFIIADKATNSPVGHIQLSHIDTLHGHAELGIAVDDAFQGQGHGGAALEQLEQYALRMFNLRKIHLRVLASNTSAVKLYEKRGFNTAGTMRKHFYHDGGFHDVLVMEKFLERQS